MSGDNLNPMPCWYVIHTKPMQEERAASNLCAWGIETLSPRINEPRYNQYSGKAIRIIKPLFPRYIFARFNARDLLHKVSFTRGILGVVSFGDGPCQVDDDIIELLKARLGENGLIQLGEYLSPGDRVIIRDGPLKNFVGIFEGRVKENDRISIMLTAVRYQNHIVIDRDLVRKAS
ncbi:MAG TPA: transcription termination/antitermination NusG family protein [Pyrinomonadaceae bacterium]|nr:transcription termination/antitermination NusG family protein [Pyrinomonadaceae bacterium]